MKKVFNSLFVIIAAMVTFAGCAKQEIDAPATPETKTVQFFANSIETKTVFGDQDEDATGTNYYPTLWTKSYKVKVHLNLESISGTEKSVDVTLIEPIDDKSKEATFKADFSDVDAESYTFYAVSPTIAWKDRNQDGVIVDIPSTQIPLENSVDEKAQVIYSISEASSNIPSSVTMDFNHLSAYGKFVLTDLDAKVTAVNSIKIEVLDKTVNLAGRWSFANDHSISPVDYETNANYLSLTTADVVVVSASTTSDVWFACGPNVDLSNKEVKFTVVTNAGELIKTVIFPEGSIFESGKIAKFSVSMKNIAPPATETIKSYEKVTDNLTDWSGKYLIVYEDGTSAYVFNGLDAVNGYVSAVISDGKIASTTDIDAVAVTIEPMTGGYAIKTANGYIYGTSGSNKLNFKSSQQLNTVSLNSGGDVAVVSNTSVLRFNSAKDNMRFRYFKSTSYTSQKAIYLYKLIESEGGETPEPEEPKILESIAVSGQTTTYTVGDPFEFDGTVTATYEGGETATVTPTSVSEPDMTSEGTETVTVSYTEGDVTVTAEYQITINPVPEITEVTVAKFLELKNTETEYILTGKITRVVNTSYGNFDLTDETGTIYVYGLLTTDGEAQKQWAAASLREGDTITLKGKYSVYNDSPQIKNAVYVSHVSAPYLEVSSSAIKVSANATSAEFTVDANVEWSVSCDDAVATKSENKVTVTFEANKTAEDVVYEVVVTSELPNQTITITQAAALQGGEDSGEVVGGQDDFDTVTSTNTSYVKSTTTSGWVATNCAVLSGGTSDSNPKFKMIGDASNRAFCMNGKTSAVGSITSPTLAGGCGTLTFNYGIPFGDNKIKFRVDIIQNGSVVKTFTVNPSSVTKLTKYTHEESINVSGNFQIVFTNLSPSNSNSNKDRTAIWDVEWTGCK